MAGLRAISCKKRDCWARWFSNPLWQAGPSTGSGQALDAVMLERGRMVVRA
jgi:hypothetical protein